MKVINRIKSNEDFVYTVRNSRALKSPSYIVHFKNNELSICRVGISVSKKLANAVMRNRIKRQIRAMCDSLINYSLHAFDIVIVVKEPFLKNDFNTNKELLMKIFEQIGIVKWKKEQN